jgi:diketogulonate reductase-like aldo/keto reductase
VKNWFQSLLSKCNLYRYTVALRWALQKGQVVIPRSAKKNRIAENLNVTWFMLTPDEIESLDALDGHPPWVM